jgi:3-deoxy-D-arabino-heptulosonate 7-phosphate (DAHP) synthase class II
MRATKDRPVIWTIDPMHGNTSMTARRKVRRLPDILAEIEAFFRLPRPKAFMAEASTLR